MTKKLPFEKAMERLEEIVGALEEGDLALEKSLKLFEEGVGHIRRLNTELEAAELTVEKLMKKNGELETAPFESDETP
ncbi:MAG: exodeoxyribonuclease VII small subunit [Deltaproteobacteria bacterium]|nr:exodeoxyribonuclease VII small subunit [Deltaproteobacteria bacterium]